MAGFDLNGHKLEILSTNSNNLKQRNKQYNGKVLVNNFQLNDHTLAFHPQTQK